MFKLYVIEVTIACPIGQVTVQVVQAGSCETDARYKLATKLSHLHSKRVLYTTLNNCSEVVQVQALRDVDGVLDCE